MLHLNKKKDKEVIRGEDEPIQDQCFHLGMRVGKSFLPLLVVIVLRISMFLSR